MTNSSALEAAIRLASEKHTGQTDKAGAPYILHPLRLMMRMDEDVLRMAAVLHDVVEDTPTTLDGLRAAGIPEEAVRLVDLLTHRPGEARTAYYLRLAADPLARAIKLADLEDNMDVRRLPRLTAKDIARLARYRQWWGRLKAMDCGGEGDAPIRPPANKAAIMEWLFRTRPATIRLQMAEPTRLICAVAELYDDPDECPDPEYAPDSEEAAEAATVDEERIEAAAHTWGRLTDDERTRLRRLLEQSFDMNPDRLADSFEELDANMPWDPDPDECPD
ncbi:MAG: bifunctional (p)ppGpp synthetase/guanosine-3',5'-bis(diphosphate) 3'-pyrophosphohydrolase [Planctomycetes bacterium]|nr:bifunctional (p)ppGpp synthetase/guanosine-3',5'-bis(diphosphate) 3'-pyrophosphohydrolase [Planctomycetota bacterium]